MAKELNILSKLVFHHNKFHLSIYFPSSAASEVFSPLGESTVYMCRFVSARVSRFVSDKEQSSVLISLLLPYLQKGNNPQVRFTT